MSIPNHLAVVAQIAEQFPEDWRAAHTGGPHTEHFIRRVAWRLHLMDRRFGLNGKRGNPNDISDDVVCYDGEAAGGDYDPTRGNAPVTVIDVIARAGADPNDPRGPDYRPAPAWLYPLSPSAAAWVQPHPVDETVPIPGPPAPTPGTPVCEYDPAAMAALKAEVGAMYALVAALTDEVMEQRETLSQMHTAILDVRHALRNGLAVEATVTGQRYVGTGTINGVAKG